MTCVENLWKIEHENKFATTLEIIKSRSRSSQVYIINNDRPHLVTFFRYYTTHTNPEEQLDFLRRFF